MNEAWKIIGAIFLITFGVLAIINYKKWGRNAAQSQEKYWGFLGHKFTDNEIIGFQYGYLLGGIIFILGGFRFLWRALHG